MTSQDLIKKGMNTLSFIHPKMAVDLGLKLFTTPLKKKNKGHLLPKDMKSFSKRVAGKKLTLYKYGNSHRKILLIHGWEGAASDFSRFYEPLVENGYEVLAVDLPGHGQSPSSRLNAIQAAKIIQCLEIEYGPFSAMIGHSFGAYSIGYAISQYKELIGIPFIGIGSPNKLSKILSNFSNFVGFSSLQNHYLSAKVEQKMNIKVDEFEYGKFIKNHEGPILIVHDKKDRQVPFRVIDEIKSETPNPNFIITEGLGHNRILGDKVTIGNIINFIENWKDSRQQYQEALKFGLI